MNQERGHKLAIIGMGAWTKGNQHRNVFLERYFVVGVIAIPYHGLGVIVNIISKEDNSYYVTIGDNLHCTCPSFTKMGVMRDEALVVLWYDNWYILCSNFKSEIHCWRWSYV